MADIASLTPGELAEKLKSFGTKPYRASQIFSWLHREGVTDFCQMTNIPLAERDLLKQSFGIFGCETAGKAVSADGSTEKYLFRLHDGEMIETVVMKYKHGYSVCVSSQAGCKMGCSFCATGKGGFSRNLVASEMLGQVYAAEKNIGSRISHVVIMGMGEPLDNYDNTLRFVRMINDPQGRHISARNISVSTCGLVNAIRQLEREALPVTLSVSLHSADDTIRAQLMPVAQKYSVDELLEACRSFSETTGRRISFEYIMIKGLTDSPHCAKLLCEKLRGMLCHVNLIAANLIDGETFEPSDKAVIREFAKMLADNNINTTIRRSLGTDIQAACGQLKQQHTCSRIGCRPGGDH